MSPSVPTTAADLEAFVILLARLSGIVALLPAFWLLSFSWRARVVASLVLTLLLWPLCAAGLPPIAGPLSRHVATVCGEVVIGFLLGLALRILLVSVELCGNLVGTLGGLSWSQMTGASADGNDSPLTRLLLLASLAALFSAGGHRSVVAALLDTLVYLPPGRAYLTGGALEVLTGLLGQSFLFGLRVAAPLVLSILAATVVVGVLGRVMPQLGSVALNVGLSGLLMIATLILGLGLVTRVFQQHTAVVSGQLSTLFVQSIESAPPNTGKD